MDPGVIMYDTLAAGEWTEDIDVKVYTNTTEGTEVVNLRVASMGNPNLRDSINVYVTVAAGIEENECNETKHPIFQLFPNPFTKEMNIRYQVNVNSDIILKIYDVSGNLIKQLDFVNTRQQESVAWDGTDDHGIDAPAGVYLVKLETLDQEIIKKVILLR